MRQIKSQLMQCLLLTLCMFVSVAASYSQRTITGTVTDAGSGEALIGATVVVSSTGAGAATDIDGTYSIQAETGDVLTFSYVGYSDIQMTVGTSDVVDVSMQEGQVLDEVVVTGYQTQRKRDITGAVSVIDSEDLNTVPAASLSQKLAGKAAGVTISTSGNPGDGTAIRIRGFNSLTNNDPLVVIDGVPTKDNFLNSINPNDIESIQVLKDAASASVYGARASNGVIVVTTKKGKAGKTKISYSGYVGSATPINDPGLVTDTDTYRDFFRVAAGAGIGDFPIYEGSYPAYYHGDPNLPYAWDGIQNIMAPNTDGTDWWDLVTRNALQTEHNLNISGGSENATFSFTGNYYDQEGTLVDTYFERFQLRANSSFKLGRFTLGENVSVSRINSIGVAGGNQSEQNVITNVIRTQTIVPLFDEGGNYAGPKQAGMGLGNNPVKALEENKDDDGNFNRLFGNVYASVDIIEGLSAKTSYGFDYGTGFTQNATFPNFEAREIGNRTFNFSENWSNSFQWTWTNTINYVNTFAEKHSVNAVVGYEANKNKGRNIGASLSDFFVFGLDSRYINTGIGAPNSRNVGSGGFISSYNSVFGKVDYVYDDFILFSASVRRDGASEFGPNSRFGTFPAGSLGVRLTRFLNSSSIDDLKVRYGYGVSGNNAIRSDNAFNLFAGGTGFASYAIGGGNSILPGYSLSARGNPDGKWEELKQHNFGIDATFLGGKLGVILDIYSKTTEDLLFTSAEPGTAGSAAPAAKNVAEMKNNGFDANIFYKGKLSSEVTFDVSLNLGAYKNEITKIDGSQTQFFSNTGTRIGNITVNRIGESIGSFFGFTTDGIFGSQAEVDALAQDGAAIGRLRFKDINNDGVINDDDRGIIGSYHPDLTAGLRLGASYKGFDFSTFIFGSFGADLFNFNKLFTDFYQFESNVRQEVATNYWSTSNTSSSIPAPDLNGRTNNQRPSTYYVEDGTYIRFENIQLGYTLPDIGSLFSNARIYVQLQNMITITDYEGLDPAFSNFGRSDNAAGVDFGNYPQNKAILFGINVDF